MAAGCNRRRFFKFAGLGAVLAGLSWKANAAEGRHGPFDPARFEEHLDRMLKHLYVEIDATEAQKARLEPIIKQAARDLMPMRQKMHEARKKGLELLSAPSVDRGAIEHLRAEQMQAADAASKRFVQALADVADVLTPEQRSKLAQRLQRHRRGGWVHG